MILNSKKRKFYVNMLVSFIISFLFIFVVFGFSEFVKVAFNSYIKYLIRYYYFPNVAVYYVSSLLSCIILIFSIFSNKINYSKRIFNYIVLGILFILFMGINGYLISNNYALNLTSNIYKDNLLVSFMQTSNLFILIYFLGTIFYYLYLYFKKNYD